MMKPHRFRSIALAFAPQAVVPRPTGASSAIGMASCHARAATRILDDVRSDFAGMGAPARMTGRAGAS